jgi:iron complex outermembrane recepter protein
MNMFSVRHFFLASLGVASFAAAQQQGEVGADDFPVVLTASRLRQPANEAPASVTVIDREMIRASGARDVTDLFRFVPGMVVGQRYGHSPTLGFNGMSESYFRQLQVLVDGVSIYSPLYGGVEWAELPFSVEDIERIEVVRGPNAAAYGSNAFSGVVNIITRDPATEPRAAISVNSGGNGIGDLSVRMARTGEGWRYRLSAGSRADFGLDALPDTRRSDFVNFRSFYTLTPSDELGVNFSYVGGHTDNGKYNKVSDGPRTTRFESKTAQIRWTRALSADDELWVQFHHSERQHHEVLPFALNAVTYSPLLVIGLPPTFSYDYPLSFSYDTYRNDLEFQRTVRLSPSLRGVWGAQYRDEGARSQTYFHEDGWQRSSLVRVFGNLEWRFRDDWIAHGQATVEHNTLTGTSLQPRFALVHEVTPMHSLRASVSSARRTPTLYETRALAVFDQPAALNAFLVGPFASLRGLPLAATQVGNAGLSDERMVSRELAYMGQFPTVKMNLDVRLFNDSATQLVDQSHQQMENFVSQLARLSGKDPNNYNKIFGFINGLSANIRGAAFDLRWHPSPETLVAFSGSRTVVDSSDAKLRASAPLNQTSLLVSQKLPFDTEVGLSYFRVGPMTWLGAGDPLPAVDWVDLRLAKSFHWGGQKAEIAWVSRNALNKPLPQFESTYIETRRSWVSFRIEY